MAKKGDRTWTDEQLRAAVAASTSYLGVLQVLGLSPRSRNHVLVQDHVDELALDLCHFGIPPRPFTDDQLRAVTARCVSIIEVLEKLGVETTSTNARAVQHRLRRLRIATPQFTRKPDGAKSRARWTDEDLRRAVAGATSLAGVLRALGLIAAGGNYDSVQKRIVQLALETSHFRGKAWNRGMKIFVAPRPLDELLVASRSTPSHRLKQRLIREGLKREACEICGWAERRTCDGVIPLELDHINGEKADNRLENLRVLCPNCHALQPTHRGLNQKRRRLKCGERDSNPHE